MPSLEAKIREYREYARMIEEMESIKSAIGDELKAIMNESGESKMIVGEYKLSYTDCTRKDLDKKRLESDHADIYAAYIKETTYKRFQVA